MTSLRRRMLEDMQLRGLAPATQQAYLRAVQQLAEYFDKSPDRITEEELRQYFLYLHNHKHVARPTATLALCAIKFLFEHTLRQLWPRLELLRPRPVHKLPIVLSIDEVWRILAQLHLLSYRTCLTTIYTCGLRLHEGASLKVTQIDSAHAAAHPGRQRQQGSVCAAAGPHLDPLTHAVAQPSQSRVALSDHRARRP